MTDYNFYELDNGKKLFKKCKYEFSILRKDSNENDLYCLFNLIFSLNHLLEWYINDNSIDYEIRKQNFHKFYPYNKEKCENPSGEFKRFIDGDKKIECNNYQRIIRHICDNNKHVKQKEVKINTEKKQHPVAQWGSFQWGNFQWGTPPGFYYYVNIDGEDWNLVTVIENLIDQWQTVLDEFFIEV